MKLVAALSPLSLCLLSGTARADLEPYSFGASETIQHQSNVNHTNDASSTQRVTSDWISTTEFNAALDQALGRQQLTGAAEVDFNRYDHSHSLDATGYSVKGALNWSTVGDLSGSIGADSRRRQYFYGLNGETQSSGRNLETDNHVFASAQLGGPARWTLFTGVDGNSRHYSSSAFDTSAERQWSVNGGTRYATSPDLSFGVTGTYTHGLYPHPVAGQPEEEFNLRSLDLTTRWQASGNSSLNATLGYSQEHYNTQSPNNFLNGSLNWNWTPPSHFTISLGLARNAGSDASAAVAQVGDSNITGHSINNVGTLNVSYLLSAKTSLTANAQYARREYSGATVPVGSSAVPANGSNRTTQFGLGVNYQASRTTTLSCNVARQVLHADASLVSLTPGYTDNTISCTGSIRFD